MLRHLLALAVVVTTATLAAGAQTPGPTNDSLDNAWLRSQINGQALIRVRGVWGSADLSRPQLAGRTLSYGRTTSLGTTSLALPHSLALDSVDRIQVRGNASGTGAMVGGGIGLLGGLAASIGLSAALCDGGCSNQGSGIAIVTLGSTLGGALIGALIGSTIKKWKTIYPPS
jgi:hypothetical protein